MMSDLLSTKDTSLVGEIGEIIARKYLWQKGINVYAPGRIAWFCYLLNRDDLRDLYLQVEENHGRYEQLDEAHQQLLIAYSLAKDFKEEQIQYVRHLFHEGPTWGWDYVGYDRYGEEVYLIEVKTSRPGKKKRGLKGSWSGRSRRGYGPEDLERAKALGFKLLLVNVELLDNWQFHVFHREL